MPIELPTRVLLLPGLGDSGPEHWQSYWERGDPSCTRVRQEEWDRPRCRDWCKRLESAVQESACPVVLCGHSSACALVCHWAATAPRASLAKVRGALLVAPSDPEGPAYPPGPTGFSPVPMMPLPFPSTVVASTDDAYVTVERAGEYARAWGSRLVILTAAGHINSASALGEWSAGQALLDALR